MTAGAGSTYYGYEVGDACRERSSCSGESVLDERFRHSTVQHDQAHDAGGADRAVLALPQLEGCDSMPGIKVEGRRRGRGVGWTWVRQLVL